MSDEKVVEINPERVREIAEGVLDYLESIQEQYTELEMVYAVITLYESMAQTIQERVESSKIDEEIIHE